MNTRRLSALITAVALSASFTSCGEKKESKKTVDINKYVDYSFSGIDTKGTCNIKIDYDKMVEENYRAFGLKSDFTNEDKSEVIKKLKAELQGNISTSDFLSNGDSIKFIWNEKNIDKLEDEYPIDIEYSSLDWNVDGLDEVIEIDPFEMLRVSFSGTAPNGTMDMQVLKKAELINESTRPTYTFHYNYDKNSGLRNGDVVTITIADSDDDIEQSGYFAAQRSKEYIVEGLDYYAEKFTDIPSDDITIMEQHNRDLLDARIASKWSADENCKNVELIKYYFLTGKEGINVSTKNYLYFIYKIDVENPEGAITYYYYTYYPDILITKDNNCVYDLNKAVVPTGGLYLGSSTYGEAVRIGNYYYTGYDKLEDLYNKHVTTQAANYSCEEIEIK